MRKKWAHDGRFPTILIKIVMLILQIPKPTDFIFIESPKLEDVAKQLSILSLRSFGRRVVILNNAQDLSGAAVSSLLKKIEEPSSGTYYLVLSTHEEKILPTLRSRLTSFRLGSGVLPGSDAAKRFLESNNLAERLEIVSNMQSAIADFIKTLCSSEMRSWGERARIRLPLLLKTFELLAANVQPSRALANLAIRW